jgi:hypothetical protein
MDGRLPRSALLTASAARPDGPPPDTIAFPGPELVSTKLVPPAPRPGLIARPGLLSLLQAGLDAKLCLVDAPAGSGKTILLAQWCATSGAGRVAWVSLDEGDNDPIRLWMLIGQALRTVEPAVGAAALRALQRTSVDLERMVLPSLLSDLSRIAAPLVLVLDDYHLIANRACHQAMTFFLNHLPASIHLLVATRVDPPLPLAGMRARRELAELRAADLQFTDEEAAALLNGSMGLQLATEDVERLAERTEGWAAGLYLAGLSLRGRDDPGAFIAAFSGDNRHVADYLTADVLARQPEEIRTFLLRTSILRRLSGPLCDHVLETEGSAELLGELERSNLFLLALDDRRRWYRYHQLFGQLLRLELANREPALVPALHRRAAAWHRRSGDVEETIHHVTAAGEFAEAGSLIARHWLGHWRRGRGATVSRWLQGLPAEAIAADPPVAFVAAWIGGSSGASKQKTERWLAAVEDDRWEGTLPEGISSLASAPPWPGPRSCSTTWVAPARRPTVPWSWPARSPRRSAGWPRRSSARRCTCPGSPPARGLRWRSWSGGCQLPSSHTPSWPRWRSCRCWLATRTTMPRLRRSPIAPPKPPRPRASPRSRCPGSRTWPSGGPCCARAGSPRPRSGSSGRWSCTRSTAWPCTGPTPCCSSRPRETVRVTLPGLGPCATEPTS